MTLVHSEVTRHNRREPEQDIFELNIRKSFFLPEASLAVGQRGCAVSNCGIFKTRLDKSPEQPQSWPCCEQEVGLETPKLPSSWNSPVIF